MNHPHALDNQSGIRWSFQQMFQVSICIVSKLKKSQNQGVSAILIRFLPHTSKILGIGWIFYTLAYISIISYFSLYYAGFSFFIFLFINNDEVV